MKNLSAEQLKSIVLSSILIILGILFCCSISMGLNGLNIILGFICFITGITFIINSAINKKAKIFNQVIGICILSLGLLFFVDKIASLLFLFIPWLLIVLGTLLIATTLLDKFYKKNLDLINFIILLVVGILCVVFGIMLRVIDGFTEFAVLIIGITMIIFAIYNILNNFIIKNKK